MAAASSDRHNDQHSHGIINAAGSADDDFASLHDLFDLSENDERSSDSNSPTPVESDQFSHPEEIDPAGDSDTSVDSAPAETRNNNSRDQSTGCFREGDVQSKHSQNSSSHSALC